MNICIDSRERKRGKKAEKYYQEKGYNVEIKELTTGDYLFNDEVVFEYKTWSDCFSSIMDHRIFNESLKQSKTYPYHYVIIAGNNKSKENALLQLYRNRVRFNMNQYYGAMARLNTYTNVIYAPSEKKAFRIMECQTEKCLDTKPLIHTLTHKTSNPALNLLMLLDDIKEKRAELICNSLGLETYYDLRMLTLKDLTEVKGIGKLTAEKILTGIGEYGLKGEKEKK